MRAGNSFAAAAAGTLLAALFAQGAPCLPDPGAAADQEAADRFRTKVVILKTARTAASGSATGFLARPGLVLTAEHAVANAAAITAWLNGVSYRADVHSTHPAYDLAALRLRAPELHLKPAAMAKSSADLAPAERLIILAGPSQPAGARGEPRDRVLIPARFQRRASLRDPAGREGEMLSLQATVERGDSGSPVIRVRDGRVVGILASRELPAPDGVSRSAYAVPIEAVHSWLDAAHRPRAAGDDEFYLLRTPRKAPPR